MCYVCVSTCVIGVLAMGTTVRAVLQTQRKNREGLYPVAICITKNRKRTYKVLPIAVEEEQWDKKLKQVKGHPNARYFNTQIVREIADLQTNVITAESVGQELSLKAIKASSMPDKGKGDFVSYAQEVIDEVVNPGTHRRYQIELDKIITYAGKKLSFGEIDKVWLTKYHHYLTKTLKNHPNTAWSGFKLIRKIFTLANEFGLTKLYPFQRFPGDGGYKFPSYIKPKKSYLTLAQCDRIWETVTAENVPQEITLVGVFACLEAHGGVRVSDWGKINLETMLDQEELVFRTTKTGTDVRLPLDLLSRLKKVVDYIKAHNLKWSYSSEHANRILKVIGPMAGIAEPLTTHKFRHTFGTHMRSIGVSNEAIAAMMGISTKQVETYAQFAPDKIRNELDDRVKGRL